MLLHETRPNGMHWMLKEVADVIAKTIPTGFSQSWQLGGVSEDWREANVIPIFERGKKEDLENCRLARLIWIPNMNLKNYYWGILSIKM